MTNPSKIRPEGKRCMVQPETRGIQSAAIAVITGVLGGLERTLNKVTVLKNKVEWVKRMESYESGTSEKGPERSAIFIQ